MADDEWQEPPQLRIQGTLVSEIIS